MRIAIDASRTTVARITGTERYAIELIRRLIALNTQHDLTLYFRDEPRPGLFPLSDRVTQRVIPQERLWTHTRFAAAVWHDRPDVTFVPAHTLPLLFPGRAVVTVHDLGYKVFPAAHPTLTRWYLDTTTAYSTRRADLILADSQATADDLTRFYSTPPEKIRVVYPGVTLPTPSSPAPSPSGRRGTEVPPPEKPFKKSLLLPRSPLAWERGAGGEGAIRAKYSLPPRYFLFFGTLQPRKNIARLAQAYRLWRERHPAEEIGLVLAGGKGWLYNESWTAGVEGVVMTGYVEEWEKVELYKHALALVMPSLYEGFGFPVVEAMQCGTPVICSATSSLGEIAGDAALLVDPFDVESIADAMTRMATDAALRESLRAKGSQQAAKFTWESAAWQTLAALEAVSDLL